MKKLFLMLVVLFIALCLFVSCDDDSSDKEAVSTWKDIDVDEDEGWSETSTITVVFYDDGSFDYSRTIEYFENGNYLEEFSESQSYTGTYKATSETAGTFSITLALEEEGEMIDCTGSYSIEGDFLQIELVKTEVYQLSNEEKWEKSTTKKDLEENTTHNMVETLEFVNDQQISLTTTITVLDENNEDVTTDYYDESSFSMNLEYTKISDTEGTITLMGTTIMQYSISGNKLTMSSIVESLSLQKF